MTVHRTLRMMTAILLAGFLLSLPASKLAAQEAQSGGAEWVQPSLPETFNAFAIVMGHVGRGHTEGLLIRITRWTTDEEDDHLTATIIERPEERNALRNELQKQEETGFIRGNSVDADWPSVRLRYARQYREEGTGKRHIILGLDRPLGFVELWDASRTLDYTVTVIVLDIDENGQGAGVLAMGTKVTYDPDFQRILMEYYSTEPVRLTNVRKTG